MAQDLKFDILSNIILSAGNLGNVDEGVKDKFVEMAHKLQGMV